MGLTWDVTDEAAEAGVCYAIACRKGWTPVVKIGFSHDPKRRDEQHYQEMPTYGVAYVGMLGFVVGARGGREAEARVHAYCDAERMVIAGRREFFTLGVRTLAFLSLIEPCPYPDLSGTGRDVPPELRVWLRESLPVPLAGRFL